MTEEIAGREVELLGVTATVPDDPRFVQYDDGDFEFVLKLGNVNYCQTLGEYFNPSYPLARVACEAAIVHFEGRARSGEDCENIGDPWWQILKKVKGRDDEKE